MKFYPYYILLFLRGLSDKISTMNSNAFDYGSFSVVHKPSSEGKIPFEFPGEFKPVVLTKNRKSSSENLH